MLSTAEGWFTLIVVIAAMTTFVSWIVFARLSMARIERAILSEGRPRPCPWDGPGARTLWYAWAIAIPVGRWNRLDDALMDVPGALRHANRADRIRAWILMVANWLLIAVCIIGWLMYDI